jgi:predicted nucleic acid-binding protein
MNLVDSCGWLEYFANDTNAGFFAPALQQPGKLLVPTICIYEVFRKLSQNVGRSAALRAVATMRHGHVVAMDDALAISAAAAGLRHKLPLADSVIVATADAYKAVIWTQDAHFASIPCVQYIAK